MFIYNTIFNKNDSVVKTAHCKSDDRKIFDNHKILKYP